MKNKKVLPKIVYVPDPDQDKAIVNLKKAFDSLGLLPRAISELVIRTVVSLLIKNYMDRRFDIPNVYYLKQMLMRTHERILINSLDGNDNLDEDLFRVNGKKAGIIMLDANFLKAFNSYFGYETGTRYLQLMVEQMNPSKNTRLAELLEKYPVDYFLASYGGDEFVMLIYFQDWSNPVSTEEFVDHDGVTHNILEEVLTFIQESIEEINLEKNLGLDLNLLARKLGHSHRFQERLIASAPGAAMTLCVDNISDKIHQEELENFSRVLEVLMGETIDEIGDRTKIHKIAVKEAMKRGTSDERLICEWFYRNGGDEALSKENTILRRKIQELSSEKFALQKNNVMLKAAIWALGFVILWLTIFR